MTAATRSVIPASDAVSRLNGHYPCSACAAIEPFELPLVCPTADRLLDDLLAAYIGGADDHD